MKKLLMLTAAALAALTLLCACGTDGNDPSQPPLASNSVIVADDSIPDGISPNITGVVTSISEVREGMVMLVEVPDAKKTYGDNRVYVTVTGKTVLEAQDKTRYQSYSQISPGDTVSVWFTGISTGTTPEYAVAQGVRVTSRVEDQLMTVRHHDSVIMASPTAGEVTSGDYKPLLYGSYLITDGNGTLCTGFVKKPVNIVAYAVSAQSGETFYLSGDGSIDELELPGTLTDGEYTVTVKAEFEDSSDYFVFTLSVRSHEAE